MGEDKRENLCYGLQESDLLQDTSLIFAKKRVIPTPCIMLHNTRLFSSLAVINTKGFRRCDLLQGQIGARG